MKAIFIYLFCVLSIQAFGQKDWVNLPEENLAERSMEEGNYALAINLYQQALDIRKAKYPKGIFCHLDAFKEVAEAMDHLIIAHSKAGDYKKHIELCQELCAWAKEGIEVFPTKPTCYLEYGLTQIKVAESYQKLKQYDRGVEVCQNLIDYLQNPSNTRPLKHVAKYVVGYAYSRAGEILKEQGQLKASATQHEKSVAAWQNTLQQSKDKLVYEAIAKQSEICVQRFDKLQDSTSVIKYAKLALIHYEYLFKKDPRNEKLSRKVETAGNTLASYKAGSGDHQDAIWRYKRSLALNEKQFKENGQAEQLEQMAALNLKISQAYTAVNDLSSSAEHLFTRVEQLIKLDELVAEIDYSYTISRNQYDLAKQHESLGNYPEAVKMMDESVVWGIKAIEKDTSSMRRKEWQWVQEFFRYQLLKKMEDYGTAYTSLDRLKKILNGLEELKPEIQYSEHIREVEVSQRELAYPEIVKLDTEIDNMEGGKMKFDKAVELVESLRKKMRKDRSMRLPFVRHTNVLAWNGILAGEYKITKKALKRAMRIKPVDPYLITNYAPCKLFLGKYKQADEIYAKYYNEPFKPGKKIIAGFIADLEEFEEEGVIPEMHRQKVDEIKAQLKVWQEEMKDTSPKTN